MPVIGTAGKKVDLLIKQGSDFVATFQVNLTGTDTPTDLTGHTVRSQIRKAIKDAVYTVAFQTFIAPDPTTGRFTLRLTSAVTSAIPAGVTRQSRESQYVWDAELVSPSGVVTPLTWGAATIHPEVTR
jgi:uncharacterized NAD-dependent epimerase/dehydratase family protein